jgi:hypothetical protein
MDAAGVIHLITDPVVFGRHLAYGPVRLVAPGIPGGVAGEDRQTVYVIGDRSAFILVKDVVFTPDVPDLQKELDIAKATIDAQIAKQIEDQLALDAANQTIASVTAQRDSAAADEKERIAQRLASVEADRVRSV